MVQAQMSKPRGPKSLPYKYVYLAANQSHYNSLGTARTDTVESRPWPKVITTPLPPPPPPKPHRKGIWIASGIFIYALTAYTVFQYATLTQSTKLYLPTQDTDVSSRYNDTASHFDQSVSWVETTSGIAGLRRRLAEQARGNVLEVSVGTGRNGQYYDLDGVKSLAFVDRSGPMVEIARRKWGLLHPEYENCSFHTQPAMDPLPASTVPKEGFTTIVQTMGVCSTPEPAATLAHLGTLADAVEARILLLEHGRSHYDSVNWILDKSAPKHADKHGCWFNRDVGQILDESGLVIEKLERSQLGTLYDVEARPRPGVKTAHQEIGEDGEEKGGGRQGWLWRLNPWG